MRAANSEAEKTGQETVIVDGDVYEISYVGNLGDFSLVIQDAPLKDNSPAGFGWSIG